MTKSEYEHQYALARKTWPTITRSALSAIIAAYEKAIEQTQAILLSRIYKGVVTFDASLKAAIDSQLTQALTEITKVTEDETLKAIHRGYTGLAMIDTKYMLDAIKQAEATTLFNATGIKNIFIKIDHDLLIATAQRVTPDAYTFSARVWKSAQGFKPDVLNIINAGFAQGKPKEKIASALSSYIKDGKIGVAKKYGKLTPESARYMQRIGKDVDWRALRLVRSEYGASLQQVAVQKAFANFGASGIMEWIRTPGAVHEDICSTYAARRYFKVSEVPGYPHPNCVDGESLINTPNGLTPIKHIKIGDEVITATGQIKRVNIVHKTMINEKVYSIETKQGTIKATGEHPLKSNDSFVLAKDLKLGDNLQHIVFDNVALSLSKNKTNYPPSVGNKDVGFFRVLRLLFNGSMPVTAIDFYGQLYVRESDIDIKSAKREIKNGVFADFDQFVEQLLFVDAPRFSGVKLRYAGSVFVRLPLSSNCRVGGVGIDKTPVEIRAKMSVRNRRKFKALFRQDSVNDVSGNSEILSYVVDREKFVAKKFFQGLNVNVDSSAHDTPIVNVWSENYKGIVYNLTVEDEHSFLINGIVSHNCMCIVRSVMEKLPDTLSQLRAYVAGDFEASPRIVQWANTYYKPTA